MPIFTPVAHDEVVAAVRQLADAIAGDGWRPDVIVGIGRGGLVPAVFLSHAIGAPMQSVDWSGGEPAVTDLALARLAGRTRAGGRLLVVDDINDSGRTIAQLRGALAAAGARGNGVRFATLIDNVASAERVDYRARSIDRRVTKDWFVFPWEAVAPAESIAADAAEVPERIG
ncbi:MULTISPECIES: phosphoribosyltransferase family protein [unclassified Sphingomonas]|uniref:phosphoribosyltransferase n=1 Tax=unclassified Sphingomonas TaxID=196159 RepID=UPI00226A3FDF|nr:MULTISPECIES: phosphoribosyltransferase family protein [unclassified Sphingomonas]